ncbi:ubiquinone biosynthesis accessory factor UbiJ [Stutzerimonas kirkiae]|uniref:Ubiquinone biosynthesis accessory factor UbiJ n=1 Tax=Stutzerimonas kirkiae TaxID=2211392 RepID=A0A4Q9REL6_9GAMM|nr:SCP2 sterol-binding domain-containing protein [Stutzerimonas kirkiae]TBU99255.1 SCP2 domain-containing protein [Stutzerimonas kirkiae]TBV06285.1 SCP2 domain-containing protein [Stutzerimonas kirkiae]TBV08029.1 SCP2 domain-containing protein [Stutzerimonas kirkiae]TBV15824.1 SCP2 domain-containing protein [Stutzerimonas kirkiae]
MLRSALLASAERVIEQALRLDATALPRLARLAGKVIEVRASAPQWTLFLLADEQGLCLAEHWEAPADCRLNAPTATLLKLALERDKNALLHGPDVTIEGDSGLLMTLSAILQDLELDWEYPLSQWIGPLATQWIGSGLRSQAAWAGQSFDTLRQNLADYLAEESRTLVGRNEAESRFNQLDELKLALDRLDARVERINRNLNTDPQA